MRNEYWLSIYGTTLIPNTSNLFITEHQGSLRRGKLLAPMEDLSGFPRQRCLLKRAHSIAAEPSHLVSVELYDLETQETALYQKYASLIAAHQQVAFLPGFI